MSLGNNEGLSPAGRKNSIHQFHAVRRERHRFMSRSQHCRQFFSCKFDSSCELVQTNRPGHAVVHVKKTGFVNLNALRHSPDTWWSSVWTRTRICAYGRRNPVSLEEHRSESEQRNSVLPGKHAIA